MRIINVREMRKSAMEMERYSRTIRLLHLVITPYLHFPFRLRTWQRTRGRTTRRERKKKKRKERTRKKERNEKEEIKKEKNEKEKSEKRICVDRKPEECEWKRTRYLRFIIYLGTKKKNLNSFIHDISALCDSSKMLLHSLL